ncbi:MAG: PD-(D/E)XK nuclease family protein, partial [Polyangiaceae bacterium]
LRAQPPGGVRQQKLLAESPRSSEGIAHFTAWLERRRSTVEAGSQPSIVARTMTELSKLPVSPPCSAAVESTGPDRASRPRGPRFGTLVHAVLAHAPFDAGRAELTALSTSLSRLIGATAEESGAAVDAAAAALSHPLMRAAAASCDARREVVVAEHRADGSVAEGVIDLAYRTESAWVVVDFKTDEFVPTEGAYAEQLRLYVEALQRATGEPARGVLLQV